MAKTDTLDISKTSTISIEKEMGKLRNKVKKLSSKYYGRFFLSNIVGATIAIIYFIATK